MAEQENTTSDETGQTEAPHITFTVKSNVDQKYSISVPESTTIADLKTKLATSEYADVPVERQRLIYSGRVMKDPDTLATYKVKDGNTVHMVKNAASNQRQNPPDQGGANASGSTGGVPQNIASGPGNDPLAGLTGARYAGFAQMPGASNFGPDGGMGPPQGPEDMLRMLDNPMFQSQMNEAMNNPHVIQMMQNSPMVRNNPMMREMLNNPEMRRMLMDPQFIRSSMRMSQMMGGAPGGGGQGGMPAPGVTDTTTQQQGGATNQGGDAANTQNAQNQQQTQPDPFAMFGGGAGGPGGLGGAGGQGQDNPFAALLGGGAPFGTGATAPSTGTGENTTTTGQTGTEGDTNTSSDSQEHQGQQPGQQQNSPFASVAQQMMQNPEMMRTAMQALGGGGLGGGAGGAMGGMGGAGQGQQPGGAGAGSGAPGSDPNAMNPFASLLRAGRGGGMAGAGGLGGFGAFGSPSQQDTVPPEEMYAEQLRQLNDMGFFDFDRNVRALRMAGGRVEGAVEMLLGGTV